MSRLAVIRDGTIFATNWKAGMGAVLTLILAGCTSVAPPADPSTFWNPPSHSNQPSPILTRPLNPLTTPLSLADLTDLALRQHPNTRQAWYEAQAAVAQVDQARGYFLPTLSAQAALQRQTVKADPESYDQDSLKFNPGLQLSCLLFNFGGGQRAAVEQALQSVQSANYTFNRTLQTILRNVAAAYYERIAAEALLSSAQTNCADAAAILQAAQERLKAGLGTELDVLQAQSGRDQADYVLAAAEGRLQIAQGTLAFTVGFPADTILPIATPASDSLPPLPPADLSRLIDEALRRRPDLQALRSTVAASEASVQVAGASRWPSLYLNGNLAHSTYDTYGGKELQDEDTSYGAGVSLQWDLYDGSRTINARRIARAQTDALRAQLEQAESTAAVEAWSRYHAYSTALKKSAAAAGFLESSTAALQLALDSYQAGLISILDVLNAESQTAQARGQFVLARHEALADLTDLAYATGLLGLDVTPFESIP